MSDKELLELLHSDPERGAEQLITIYTGLLWSLASRYLSEPEDIKDCVNDTFAEFFCHRERFDPKKGSLKGYLAAVVRCLAIKRYWQERQYAEQEMSEGQGEEDLLSRLEQSDELEAALHTLEPLDERIIRMKYYGGMTAKEIAASLDIPYETVKKRHQRSLKKLMKALTVGFVVAALLAACAYVVLRYFGIVPGYGVNTDPERTIYVLESAEGTETEDYSLTVTDAWWNDGVFIADAEVLYRDTSTDEVIDRSPQLTTEDAGEITVVRRPLEDGGGETLRLMAGAVLPEESGKRLTLTLVCDGTPLVLTLCPAEAELTPDEAGYYSLTEEDGGLLAIPRLENGELIVSVYPLNAGDFRTDIRLTQGIWAGFGAASAPVTVTAEDGTVLTGHPVGYSPYSGDGYSDWSFGPAEAGAYVLTVPYVYQTAAESGTFEWELSLPETASELNLTVSIPDGNVTLGSLTSAETVENIPCGETMLLFPSEMYGDQLWWTLEAEWNADDPERIPAAVPLTVSPTGDADADIHLRTRMMTDASDGMFFGLQDYVLHTNDPTQPLVLRLAVENICYRWEHSFRIPFEITE